MTDYLPEEQLAALESLLSYGIGVQQLTLPEVRQRELLALIAEVRAARSERARLALQVRRTHDTTR